MKKDSKTQLTTLETALQKQFKPDENRLETIMRESYELTAKIQSANIAAIVGFGLLALSIKPIIGHGKFGGWLKGVLGGQMSKSTAYSWIEAAKYLIAKISTAEKQTDIISVRICEFIAAVNIKNGAEEIFSDAKLTSDFVAHVSTDLPFRTFLNILKTANAAAIEAEDEERAYADEQAEQSKPQPKNNLRGLQGGDSSGGQMTFFDELFDEVRATIEIKRENDPRFLQLSKEEMDDLGNYLIEQGKAILNLAKEKRD